MNIYNINFDVKYRMIQDELNISYNKDLEYNKEDILLICDKLYRDELISVFNASNLLDDKIDNGMKYVLEKMLENSKFKLMMDGVKVYLKNKELIVDEHEDNIDMIIILTLFSQDCFYIFHKCICQQISLGIIEEDLLVKLDEFFSSTFNK
jgi:hypothetical protein